MRPGSSSSVASDRAAGGSSAGRLQGRELGVTLTIAPPTTCQRPTFRRWSLAVLLAAGLVLAGATPAFAADSTLCSNADYGTCASAGYTDHGYGT